MPKGVLQVGPNCTSLKWEFVANLKKFYEIVNYIS